MSARAVRDHAYKEAHREELTARQRAYRVTHPEERAAQNRAYRAAHPEKAVAYRRRHQYGLAPAEFDAILEAQAGLCLGCGAHMVVPHVDHDHTGGRIRGLLCRDCNVALGILKDNPVTLRALADYLEDVHD